MKFNYNPVLVCIFLVFYTTLVSSNNPLTRAFNKPKCAPDTILYYSDCKMCSCTPRGKANCFDKPCDLRTKDTGFCPVTYLKQGQYNTCGANTVLTNSVGICKTDDECPGPQLCCFDFCHGTQCMNPTPLNGARHPGRGYPSS